MLLIFTLTGIYLGFYRQATAYIDSSGADIWVVQKGAPNFFFAVSFLPSGMNQSIASVTGVKTVSPLIAVGATITKNNRSVSIFFFGYDTRNGLGAPSPIIQGSAITGENQVVVDFALASKIRVGVGDVVSINGHRLSVVGISGVGGVLAPIAFSSLTDVQRIAGYGNFVNYFLVKVSQGASPESISSSLTASIQGVSVFSNSDWARASRDAVLAGTAPVIQAMEFMGGLTGVLIIGLTNYTAVVERQREYGILKALGIKSRNLLMTVLWQSIIVALSGFGVAAILTIVAIRGLAFIVQFPLVFVYDLNSLVLIFVTAMLIGAGASLVPVRRILRIDPAIAFK
jgi:putative ABC transport system permease protein